MHEVANDMAGICHVIWLESNYSRVFDLASRASHTNKAGHTTVQPASIRRMHKFHG